jgi:competence protein ComEA
MDNETQATAGQPVDVNTANQAMLDALPGVGPQEAAAIVAYREKNGPYRSVDDLKTVPGVSRRSVENVRGDITVGSESEFAKMQQEREATERFSGRP